MRGVNSAHPITRSRYIFAVSVIPGIVMKMIYTVFILSGWRADTYSKKSKSQRRREITHHVRTIPVSQPKIKPVQWRWRPSCSSANQPARLAPAALVHDGPEAKGF